MTEAEGGTLKDGSGPVVVRRVRNGGAQMCNDKCSHIISGLNPGTYYQARIRGRSLEGWSPFSGASDPFMTRSISSPTRPATPKLSSKTSSIISVTLTQNVAAAINEAVHHYEVQYDKNGDGAWITAPKIAAVAVNLLSISGLDNAYKVRKVQLCAMVS